MLEQNVPNIAERIQILVSAMRGKESFDEIARNVNDILLYGDKIPLSLLNPSWDYFAKRKGVSI